MSEDIVDFNKTISEIIAEHKRDGRVVDVGIFSDRPDHDDGKTGKIFWTVVGILMAILVTTCYVTI